MNTCQNCKYWDEDKNVGYTPTEGKCRAGLPVLDMGEQALGLKGYWPSTQVDDWCGQHKPKDIFTAPKYTTQQEIDTLMIDLVRKHGIASNAMTEQQIADALRQAIACGDFTRHVKTTGDAQCVVYLPFTRECELLSEIYRLKKFIEANGMKVPTSCCESY